MNKKRSMIKRRRRKRGRSRFEVIAVNQLSCGARDSLSEGMRDAQIAITELLHLCTEMISSHPHIPIVQLRRWVIKHSCCWTLMSFAAKKQMYSGQNSEAFFRDSWRRTCWVESKIIAGGPDTTETEDMYSHFADWSKKAWGGDGGMGLGGGGDSAGSLLHHLLPRVSLPDPQLPPGCLPAQKITATCSRNILIKWNTLESASYFGNTVFNIHASAPLHDFVIIQCFTYKHTLRSSNQSVWHMTST